MNSIYYEIINEIQRLRRLKQLVIEDDFKQCDINASNICLSADILLIPLYWYITSSQHERIQPMEEYIRSSVSNFDKKAHLLIPRIIERTKELDNLYISKPFEQYRELLKKCFPQYTINFMQK